MIDEKQIREALQAVLHPKLKKPLMELGMIRNISSTSGVVNLTFARFAVTPVKTIRPRSARLMQLT